jgi:pilus assembly protein CpaC
MTKRLLIPVLCLLVLLFAPEYARAEVSNILAVSVDHGIPLSLSAPAASVFIANPDVADIQVMSPTSVMVFGKKTGETTLMATDNGGRTILHKTVVVTQNLSDLRREMAAAIPGNKITIAAVPDGIILTGQTRDPSSVEDARKIAMRYVSASGTVINRIQVAGSNQIMIRVRFAEVSRTIDNSFGIDWGSIASVGGFVFGLASGNPVNTALQGGTGGSTAGGLFPRPNNSSLAEPNDVLGVSHQGSHYNINGMIDALAQNGLVTILAEPNLTAMSGETAYFLAGGEVPIPVPQANGTISIEYKDYGVSLQFTPTLVSENRINLHIKPEVSQLTTIGSITLNNIAAPAFLTRKAETTVELASGQSFAIAGLLNNDQDQTINKFPFLGDVPILGPLFRSSQFQNNQTELVVIITPYVVKPGGSEQQMALPTDGYAPPSDAERVLGLRTNSGDPNARPVSGQALAAPGADAVPTANEDTAPQPTAAAISPVSTSNLGVTHVDRMQEPMLKSGPVSYTPPSQPIPGSSASATEPMPVAHSDLPVSHQHLAPPPANPNASGSPGFLLE